MRSDLAGTAASAALQATQALWDATLALARGGNVWPADIVAPKSRSVTVALNNGYRSFIVSSNLVVSAFSGVTTNVNWTALTVVNTAATNVMLSIPSGVHCAVPAKARRITHRSTATWSVVCFVGQRTNSTLAPNAS